MKYSNTLIGLGASLILGLANPVNAATDKAAVTQAEEKASQEQLRLEHEEALVEAERQRKAAETSMVKAREKLQLVSEQQRQNAKETAEARAAQQAEMAKMREELELARRQLRETSREIARVNREVARAQAESRPTRFVVRTSDRPVIGVILGETTDVGIEVLGVSPDGPSERAGIEKGDVIIAVDGQVLASIDETEDMRDALRVAMKDIKVDVPITIAVERQERTLDLTVVPEIREPLTWKTVTRFPSAASAPVVATDPADPASTDHVITVERIVVPEINTEGITKQINQMRVEIAERRALRELERAGEQDGEFEFEFHDLSEFGDHALHDANIWFGLPLTHGLSLAEVDAGLGEYFKTERGVLVLKAKADNDLQLQSGDVILQVDDTEVNSPAEFMRALREFDSGDEFVIDIKRNRKNHTLNMVMPDQRSSFNFSPGFQSHVFSFSTKD
jgi:C-terminal processing protease CtpA/Prc